jgi:hypothetical protein
MWTCGKSRLTITRHSRHKLDDSKLVASSLLRKNRLKQTNNLNRQGISRAVAKPCIRSGDYITASPCLGPMAMGQGTVQVH